MKKPPRKKRKSRKLTAAQEEALFLELRLNLAASEREVERLRFEQGEKP